MTIIDHVGIQVSDYGRAKAFYEKALAPLGITLLRDYGHVGGFGREGKPEFWLGADPGGSKEIQKIHVAVVARNREEVDSFYKAALAAGGRDNGSPGLRPHYHERYYGAFVLDPDGHNVEAVYHGG